MQTKSLTCSLAVAVLILAACHNDDDSFSHAARHAPSTPPPPSPRVSTAEAPPAPNREVSLRPREIRFDDNTKPCDLLSPSQVQRLGGDTRQPTPATEPEWRSPTCVFGGPTRIWSVTTVTDTGVEFRFDVHQLHGQLQVGYADPIAVAFPAYTAVDPARVAVSCYLAIDTSEKQMLVIGIELSKPADKRTPCAAARPIAEEVMRTLIT